MQESNWDRLIDNLAREGILHSPKVINALRSVPRTDFLPENMRPYGADDTPLPIGFGQTASAPHSLGFRSRLGETWFQ
jgi:protein-L-isoaspartate(D-aspartate) O-methyltransferase